MRKTSNVFYFLTAVLIMFAGCGGEDEEKNDTLSASPSTIYFFAAGGANSMTIRTSAKSWAIENSASEWVDLSATSGSEKTSSVTITIGSRSLTARSTKLLVKAGNAEPVEVEVKQVASDFLYGFTANVTKLEYEKSSSAKSLEITTDAPTWNIGADVDWIELSKSTGVNGKTTISVTVLANSGDAREGVISVTTANAPTLQIPVKQKGALYPNYNTSPIAADATGMSSNAVTLASKIKLGWNIGNTLEATGGETAWGNPKVTKALVDLVKQNGFNAIRIPCAWNQYMENSTTAKLQSAWLDRVKEVVQYCVDNDMYVLLNIHWDGGWLENNCTQEKQDANNAKQKAFWEQIATHLRGFDEHLIFASANEPNVENATQMAVLTSYHQTFVDAVRSTGGKNTYRVLVVQGPYTDIDKTNNLMTTLPTDATANRMMVEVHYYTPWNFCGLDKDETWGKMFYYWGKDFHSATDTERNATWGEEDAVVEYFDKMKIKFVDKGIPVVLGEYSAMLRSSLTGDALALHRASRNYYLKYVTQQATAKGLLPFFWDNGAMGDKGSALFNRATNTVFDQQAVDALVAGAVK